MNKQKKPIVAWKACESRFVWMSDYGHESVYHLDNEDAIRHWQGGTALFLENAQREVSHMAADRDAKIEAAFQKIERLNREFSYRVSFFMSEGSSLENACNMAQEEIDDAVADRRAL